MPPSPTLKSLSKPEPVGLATDLSDLIESAKGYVDAARAPSTLRAYDFAWRAFIAWCDGHGLDPLPADPEMLGLYVTHLAKLGRHPTTITRALSAIRLRHEVAKHHSPTLSVEVRTVMRGIRRTIGVAPRRRAEPLLVGDLLSIVEAIDTSTLLGLRDKALLLVGFSAALRRSEIVALDVGDVSFRSKGLALRLRRSKTDQEGEGRSIGIRRGRNGTCPVVACRTWLSAAGIVDGPLFRGLTRHDTLRKGRLSTQTVCRVVKSNVPLSGLKPAAYSGHSMRSGFATSAAAVGIEERHIALTTGHRSLETLRGYIREGTLLDGGVNVIEELGL